MMQSDDTNYPLQMFGIGIGTTAVETLQWALLIYSQNRSSCTQLNRGIEGPFKKIEKWRLCLRDFSLRITDRAGIVHSTSKKLLILPDTSGFQASIDDHSPIQSIKDCDTDLCYVQSDADAYFELEENEVSLLISVSLEELWLPFIAEFVEAQRASSLSARLCRAVG